jgi:endo-1,4-beta-xylanase
MFLNRGCLGATGVCLAGGARAAESSPIPALRKLAAGRPLIGVAVPTRFETKFEAEEMALLKTQFDSVTPENCMKWDQMCPSEEECRWEQGDRLVEFAVANGQKMVGHTLVFNRDSEVPEWLFPDGEKEADAKLVWERIEERAAKLTGRYKGKIDSWDVLNEFVEEKEPGYRVTNLTKALGRELPARLFQLAADLDPKAKLTYNDYGIEKPNRRKVIFEFIRKLKDEGCKIDVVGSQSHLEVADDVAEQIAKTIEEFAAIGVKCAFTELDVDVISRKPYWNQNTREEAVKQDPYKDGCPDEVLEQQAGRYRAVFEAVMANRKHVDRVTLWGLTDAHSWLNNWPWKRVNHGLLFDREARPKPAFHAVAEVLAQA